MSRFTLFLVLASVALLAARAAYSQEPTSQESAADAERSTTLHLEHDSQADAILVHRRGLDTPVVTQHADPEARPYLHPIVAPDGRGQVTEFSPEHHRHQTGLYWGFARLNGRDFFHHAGGEYWRRVSADILKREAAGPADSIRWRTVYDLLDASGAPLLRETQTWSMRVADQQYVLDLKWEGEALADVVVGEYDYGGLFLRMPWQEGTPARVVNSARHENARAEGQRAVWLDVGVQTPDRDDMAHVAIFDHPENKGFPQPWRVDDQFGVGPVRARLGDWRIAKGDKETIRHRLVVYTGELDDVALTEQWSKFSGQEMAWAEWGLAQQEGREAEFLTPEAAVDAMTVADGFEVDVFAAEPMISQPMAFCWDDRGRLWIAENRDYETRQSGFSASGDSRILILEDTDRDGRADKKTVFAEGIAFPAAMAVGFDGLWLGAPPNLLFLPDRNNDDRAEMEDVEVRLTGWGIKDRHETLNSFHWGPDGWLYGCQGFATPSQVGKPLDKGRVYGHNEPFPEDFQWDGPPVDINGGVWRYHPTKDRFEVVAHGFSNPWGIDYDAHGQMFITACVIPHLWHVIPGGIYHRQGGSHFNPHVYSDIRTIADHRHRSAHGGARIYQSDALPDKYQNRIFMANIHEHAVLTDVLEPQGSGFVGRHGDDFLLANNAQWIGFSLEIGPDGALYVLDWHDADICGKEVLNKETGRVFRVASEAASTAAEWPDRYVDLRTLSDERLVELQLSPSAWHARRARVILQHRSNQSAVSDEARSALRDMFQDQQATNVRLRAMWALHVVGDLGSDPLQRALSDSDPYVRAWAIQLLCEDGPPSAPVLQKFASMARSDSSPVVRLYLAAAMQRIPVDGRWTVLDALVQREEDAADHNLPKMIWFALEPAFVEDPNRALAVAAHSRLPSIARFVARRLTDADMLDPLVGAIRESDSRQLRAELLLGMRDGLESEIGRRAPSDWAPLYDELQQSGGEAARLSMQLAQQFGDEVAAESLLKTVQHEQATLKDRRDALRALAAQPSTALEAVLLSLLDQEAMRVEAIRAAAALDSQRLGEAMLQRYSGLDDATQLEVVQSMASRSQYGRQLTAAISSGAVPRRDIPAYVARLLQRTVGNGFLEVWGPVEALAPEQAAALDRYREMLTPAALAGADAGRGRVLFERTCAVCHTLYGEGGKIGPDITGANRSDLEYLLGNIMTPSAVIQDDYKMLMVLTDQGRVLSGILAGENERQLRLRVPGKEEPVVVAKSQIESRETSSVSIMPERMLDEVSDREVVDLIAYLQSLEQVPLPE